MIERYFTRLEQQLQAFPAIQASTLTRKRYNAKQGYIKCWLTMQINPDWLTAAFFETLCFYKLY
jgi:hypothetical protein